MAKHIVFFLAVLVFSTKLLSAQENSAWKFYPSFSSVNSLSYNQDQAVVTTEGGIIIINNSNDITTLSVSDGLYSSDVKTAFIDDASEKIYLGYLDGTIDVINKMDGGVKRLSDIRRVERFDSKSINSFYKSNNSLFVATNFGLVEYDTESLLVRNSYLKFGDFDYGIDVTDLLIHHNILYVTTVQGIATADVNEELSNNNVWTTYDESDGLNSTLIEKIVTFSDSIYVLNKREIRVFNKGIWEAAFPQISDEIVDLSVAANQDYVFILTQSDIYIYDLSGIKRSINISDIDNSKFVGFLDGNIILGTEYKGIYALNQQKNEIRQILPDGPQFNYLNNLLIDNDVLVGTLTSEFPGFDPLNPFRGYSIYDGKKWANYNRLYNQKLASVETVFSVGKTLQAYFLGSWGDGVIKHTKSENEIEVYNSSNSNLTGINSDENFVVISGLNKDSENNMWAISYLSDNPLNVLQEGSNEWQTFGNVTGSDNYYNLFIDSKDQKWISLITNNNTGLGLLVLDTKSVTTQSDDEYVKLTEDPARGNLPHQKVNAIIEDRNGEVWIGTERGIARFIFPEFVIRGTANERQAQWLISEDTTAESRFLLRDLNVSAMAVNSANEKWIGSRNQGVWLLNNEGSRILKRFTAEKSNLISNNINDIKVNEETGEVYISTDMGLVSYQDVPIVSENNMNSLKVYPNPFKYKDHDQILIEGLSEETIIKILGIDGFVVKTIETRGGRVNWNGRDFKGNKLGTGVYFVVANSTNDNEKAIGKIVIVN